MHAHLMRECPWYRRVESGERDHPDMFCRAVSGDGEHEGGALVKFTPRTPEASTVPRPTVPPGGPGLFHVKGLELPPYIQHLYSHLVARYGRHDAYRVAVGLTGVVKKWAEGVNPGGYKTKSGKGKRTHPDVRAAAARNVALWEKDKALAHAQHGDREAKATAVELAGVMTAPGARPTPVPSPTGGSYAQYGLHQRPAATISPSPPLPPDVKIPTPAEVLAVLPLIPDCSQADLSATARKFVEQAAAKIGRGNPIEALSVLRSAQTAVYACHKADLSELMPAVYTANVFSGIPPASQSSATTSMKQGQEKQLAWRKAEMAVAALADRIRKKFFHGLYNGPSQLGRFTEDGMTALDRVLALAGAPITTGKDVSFPTTSDASGRTPLIQPPEGLTLEVGRGRAADELAEMPALDRARFNAYLQRARDMMGTNRGGAAQSALRAAMIAHDAGAHRLARLVHGHVQALAAMGNVTHTGAEAGRMEHGKAVSPQNSPQTVADTGNQTPMARLTAVERLELAVHAGRSTASSSSSSSSSGGSRKSGSGGTWLPLRQWEAKVDAQDAARTAAQRVPGARPEPRAGTVIRSQAAPAGTPGPATTAEHLHGLHQLHEAHLNHIAQMHAAHLAGK